MKKYTILTFAIMLMLPLCKAQQDPQFSQNMFNKLFQNSGYAGSNGAICGSLLGRQQWAGFEGKPETFQLSLHAPVPLLYGGAGLVIYQDQLGQEKTFGLKATYAYRRTLGQGKIGLGIGLGMINKSLGNKWSAIDDINLDTRIPIAGASKTGFDMDLGVYYNSNKLYVGVSTMHLPATTLTDANFNFDVQRHYYIMGGYTHDFAPTNIQLKPSVFVKTDGASTQIDFGTIALWNNKVWAGVSYRIKDAVVAIGGFQKVVGDGTIKIGYAYDVTTSRLRNHSTGSHEIMLGYCLKLKENLPPCRVKTVRFL